MQNVFLGHLKLWYFFLKNLHRACSSVNLKITTDSYCFFESETEQKIDQQRKMEIESCYAALKNIIKLFHPIYPKIQSKKILKLKSQKSLSEAPNHYKLPTSN